MLDGAIMYVVVISHTERKRQKVTIKIDGREFLGYDRFSASGIRVFCEADGGDCTDSWTVVLSFGSPEDAELVEAVLNKAYRARVAQLRDGMPFRGYPVK